MAPGGFSPMGHAVIAESEAQGRASPRRKPPEPLCRVSEHLAGQSACTAEPRWAGTSGYRAKGTGTSRGEVAASLTQAACHRSPGRPVPKPALCTVFLCHRCEREDRDARRACAGAGASAEGQQVHTELWVTGQTQARAQQRRSRAVGECGRGNERPARSCKRRPRRGRRVPPSPAPPGDPGQGALCASSSAFVKWT